MAQAVVPSGIISPRDFGILLHTRRSPCLTLYLPTHRTGREQQQDRIRLKNLLRRAERELEERGIRRREIDPLLEPLRQLLADEPFWRYQGDGLALFRCDQQFHTHRLPTSFDEQLVIGEQFHLKPLLPLLHSSGRFFLLGLSQDAARLFEATRDAIRELELPPIPRAEIDGDQTAVQLHSQRRGVRPRSDEAIFHGTGGTTDRSKADALQFFHRVDEAVTSMLRDQTAPLVLACVGYLAPLYESANTYAHLFPSKVPGHPQLWTEDELRQHAWILVEPYFRQAEQAALDAARQAAGTGRLITDIREAIVSAGQGRIATLLLQSGVQQWGMVDPAHEAVQVAEQPGQGVELTNHAALQTLRHGGDVFLVTEIPAAASPIAAVPRF